MDSRNQNKEKRGKFNSRVFESEEEGLGEERKEEGIHKLLKWINYNENKIIISFNIF